MRRRPRLCRWFGHRWKVTEMRHPAKAAWVNRTVYCGRCFAEKESSDG